MPWSQNRIAEGDDAPQPVLNAPLVAVAVAVSMPLLYLVQVWVGPSWIEALAFRPSSLFHGGWWPGLVTDMFAHSGWGHVGGNAALAFAFGAPVARILKGVRGVFVFLLFYMTCGVTASIGYALIHPGSDDFLIGASGAVFGLIGAGLRLLGRRDGTLRALTDRKLLTPAAVLMALNVLVGLIGLAPGAIGLSIAWEAHAVGFLVGLFAIGPVSRIMKRKPDSFDSPDDSRDPPV